MNYREWFELGSQIADLEHSLRMAETRVLTFDELRARLPGILTDRQSEAIIRRFSELTFDPDQADQLLDTVRNIAMEAEGLDTRQKTRADAIIGRLARLLPDDFAVPFALGELTHKRKRRRDGAYKVLKVHMLPGTLAPKLVEAYELHGDDRLLQLIARNAPLLAYVDVVPVLAALSDRYWRMRVVEGLLVTHDPRVNDLAEIFPTEFAHAVGRLRLSEEVGRLKDLCNQDSIDVEFLSLYTWAMGRLGVRDEVARMKELAASLRRGFDATEPPND